MKDMEAKDLRIGNFIFDIVMNEVVTVTNLFGDNTYARNSFQQRIDLGAAKGIELTEEWLIKLGFEKPAHTWIGDIFHLTEWDMFPLNWCVAMNKNNAVVVHKLKYVHDLQNLYKALTGNELLTGTEI